MPKPFRNKHSWTFGATKERGASPDIENPTSKGKGIALLRLAIIKDLQSKNSKISKSTTKTQAMREFLQDFNSGMILPVINDRPDHLSRSTLYGWQKAYREGGVEALIPRYPYKKSNGKNLAFLNIFPAHTEIKIPGPPQAKGKHRFLGQLRKQWKNSPLDGPVVLAFFFSMPIPKGKMKMKTRMPMLKHEVSHRGKPTLASLTGFTLGCMSGIVFKDHSQIINLHTEKEFSWTPQTRIVIKALPR